MTTLTQLNTMITNVERVGCSRNGNPTFNVTTADGDYRTLTDGGSDTRSTTTGHVATGARPGPP